MGWDEFQFLLTLILFQSCWKVEALSSHVLAGAVDEASMELPQCSRIMQENSISVTVSFLSLLVPPAPAFSLPGPPLRADQLAQGLHTRRGQSASHSFEGRRHLEQREVRLGSCCCRRQDNGERGGRGQGWREEEEAWAMRAREEGKLAGEGGD
eukprot:56532-Hanusia_phi.AAC.2